MSPGRVGSHGKGLDRWDVFRVQMEILLRLFYTYRARWVTKKIRFGILCMSLALSRIRQVRALPIQSGMQSAKHAQAVRVQTEVRPLWVDYANPQSTDMVSRGGITEAIVVDWVNFISERRTPYETPVNTPRAQAGPKSAQYLPGLRRW